MEQEQHQMLGTLKLTKKDGKPLLKHVLEDRMSVKIMQSLTNVTKTLLCLLRPQRKLMIVNQVPKSY